MADEAERERRRKRTASEFKRDPRYDRLIAAIEKDPHLDSQVSTQLRLQLGYYKLARQAAKEHGFLDSAE